jgi:major vault protein
MTALAPELVTTLKVLGDQHLATELTKNLSPLAILGGESVAEVVQRLLKGLPIGINLTDDGNAKANPQLQKPADDKKR